MENSDVLIKAFKLDYVDHEHKIINCIDQIEIFALFNDDWVVVKKVAVEDGVVHLIKKDGTSVNFEENDPSHAETLDALKQVTQAFKDHFKKYD
jgi:hypothetical protein